MQYVARVEVGLKPGHSDPEGETTKDSLVGLNYAVGSVKVSKVYELHVEAPSLEDAQKMVDEMSRRLLANPVKDNFTIHVEESR